MRRIYHFDDQGRVLPENYSPPLKERTHAVHGDTMDVTFNHANCKYYDSKSQFRKGTREAGCHEVGNDYMHTDPSREFAERRKESMHKIDWRGEINQTYDRFTRNR
jgi:hypothetical protein